MSQENKVFARQSSGLTRTLSARDTFLLNFMYLAPAASIAYPLTFAFFFPGSNWILATIIGALMALPTAFMYYYIGMLTPKTAADYVYVSRYLGPIFGLMQALVNIFAYGIGLDVQTEQSLVIVPFIQSLGLSFHNSGLISLANAISSSQLDFFIFTTIMILIVGGILILSTKWIARIVSSLTILQIIGTIVIIVLLFDLGRAGFISSFNSLSTSLGGNTYQSIVSSYKLPISFDALGTFLLGIMIMGNLFIYNNAPVWVGGEVKKGEKTIKAGIIYSYLFAVLISIILVVSIVYTIGEKFFIETSEFGWATSSGGIPVAPYSLLAYVIIPVYNNLPILLIILISSLTWYISYAIIGGLTGTRAMVAASMDRLLPEKFVDISPKLKSPYFAVLVFLGIALLFNYLEIYQGFSLTLMFGVLSYMIFQYLIASLSAFKISKSKEIPSKIKGKLLISSILSAISIVVAVGSLIIYGGLTYTSSGFGYQLFSGNFIPSALLLAGIVIAAILWYVIAKVVRKKKGVNVDMVFTQIPPD
ncbi:APC family permease [Acidianus manzaensis]|uniref:Amino acid permease/ SLC12A domain-containing protein n=1 Tax=Acidianus manzaensis TaxID=282676 RepID=A0A1W6JYJ8_9CREN|nr:amino acid permease [Acidianus manzaensis]ARM75391.1 hypothetical protein B6F84_04680 [Acidianus manzaensis]